MSEFCFSFLENQFRDIYLDCARMDKNLIEGDGVEAILIAGRIAEKITKSIFAFEGLKDDENSQFKRIEKLNNANILPNNIKNDFSRLRRLRNDVYHNTVNGDAAGGFKSSAIRNAPYVQNGGLRDYKTGFNEVKDFKSSSHNENINSNANSQNSNPFLDKNSSKEFSAELEAANEAHKIIFNICVWFYVNYSGDKDFIRPKYKVSRRTQDADFLIRLKSAINDGKDFIRLKQSSPNNEIIQILNELYVPKVSEEKEENVYSINNQEIKIRKPDVPYSQCLGISYDDNLFMWNAQHGNKDLGLYASSKEAYEAREIYISSLPMAKKVDGVYSKARGISFSRIQKLWSVSVKGQIISYHATENEAIKSRKDYLKENGLVDVKVKGGFKTITLEERDRLRAKSKEKANKKTKSKTIKSIDSKASIKTELNKKSKIDSNKKSNKLDYGNEFNTENKSKVKVVDGNKISSEEKTKKVKVSGGSRVSKNKSNKSSKNKNNNEKSESTINKKKSSKYKGVYYEDGLFMWSAEVDGKHLGLFPTEEEAHEKREEYIKNSSSI